MQSPSWVRTVVWGITGCFAKRAGMHCASGAAASARAAEGFKLITVAVDSRLLESAVRRELAEARGGGS